MGNEKFCAEAFAKIKAGWEDTEDYKNATDNPAKDCFVKNVDYGREGAKNKIYRNKDDGEGCFGAQNEEDGQVAGFFSWEPTS